MKMTMIGLIGLLSISSAFAELSLSTPNAQDTVTLVIGTNVSEGTVGCYAKAREVYDRFFKEKRIIVKNTGCTLSQDATKYEASYTYLKY